MGTLVQRRNDIDYLRVISILAVFVFHSARFFDSEGWHVKNPVTGMPFDAIIFVLHKWIMPIFFVLAGAGAWYSLQTRSGGQYIKERVYRLLIPLLFGIFTIIPHQVYIERITAGRYKGMSLLEFYPHYFEGLYGFGGNFAWMGLHLWFLLVLFVFAIITLPVFLPFRRTNNDSDAKQPNLGRLLILYSLFILVFLSEGLLFRTNGFGEGRGFGGWFLMDYILFFVLGYFVIPKQTVTDVLIKYRWLSLIVALAALTGLASIQFGSRNLSGSLNLVMVFYGLLMTATSWIGILAFIGLAASSLTAPSRFLKYAAPAVMPFYFFHQSVIVAVGYFMIPVLNDSLLIKYFLLMVISFTIIMVFYELVRRIPIIRFLCGIKG